LDGLPGKPHRYDETCIYKAFQEKLANHELPKTMIPATGNNWNFTGIGRKEAEKSLDPAGNVRKMMRNGSSIPTGKFSDFFR
jgi:hypothetical protein